MRTISLEELLEAGCHFGHQVTRQNPKAREYIFQARDGIHIIDLAKTKAGLDETSVFVKQLATKPESTIIILGAKRQAQAIVKEEAERAIQEGVNGLYFVTNRWIGGTLTNFDEVSKNFRKLKDLTEKLQNRQAQSGYTKKEISLWEKERQKLLLFYGGIAEMKSLPDALFIVDTHMEDLAVREAGQMHIPTVGITDTNADPTMIDYPIPANDDAVGSVQLIIHHIVDAWIEGKKKGVKGDEENVDHKTQGKNKKAEVKARETASTDSAKPQKKKEKTAEFKK